MLSAQRILGTATAFFCSHATCMIRPVSTSYSKDRYTITTAASRNAGVPIKLRVANELFFCRCSGDIRRKRLRTTRRKSAFNCEASLCSSMVIGPTLILYQ